MEWDDVMDQLDRRDSREAERQVNRQKLRNDMYISWAADALIDAQKVLFITGAGISAESGVPTYRGKNGLYNDPDPETGMEIEKIVSKQMLEHNPDLVWKHIRKMEMASHKAKPNAAHRIITEIQTYKQVKVLTQNIDGLHQKAGTDLVCDIHGNVHQVMCPKCLRTEELSSYEEHMVPPKCSFCGTLVRPNVVLFGEEVSLSKLTLLDRHWDMVFSIGTTSIFPYIINPVRRALLAGKPVVEINPERTMISDLAIWRITEGAGSALTKIWELAKPCI